MTRNFRRGKGGEEFMTVRKQEVSFNGKFVTRGEGFEKVVFQRDVIC